MSAIRPPNLLPTTQQARVLRRLAKNGPASTGDLTVMQLRDAIGDAQVAQAYVSALERLERLRDRDWVRRRKDGTWVLTALGRAQLPTAGRRARQAARRATREAAR